MTQAKNNNRWCWSRLVRFFALRSDASWPKRALSTQSRILREILFAGEATVFGHEHGINAEIDLAAFRAKVPVSSYEELFPYIERTIKGEANVLSSEPAAEFARSSGTANGRSKYIPTPRSYMQGNHLKAARDIATSYARSHKGTRIFSGKAITITGSYGPMPESVFLAGDISALITNAMPWWAEHSRPYPKEVGLQTSWESKAGEIVAAARDADIVVLGGTPTWMLEILELSLKDSGKKTVRELWPNLEVFFHGAVSFAPYRKTFETIIGEPGIEFREVYNASEGVFAYEDDAYGHPGELLLCTDHGIFYEFIPVEDCVPKGLPVGLGEVELGVPYALVITTKSGLWRYQVGDVIVFASLSPYRLRIVGRTTQYMNAFGEEVVADNAVRAIEKAALATSSEVAAFTAAPTFHAAPAQGAHEWIVEFRTAPKGKSGEADFAKALDAALKELNSDYEAKRAGTVVLGTPIVHIVAPGTFRAFLEGKGKLGGQHKMPQLSNERSYVEALLALTSK